MSKIEYTPPKNKLIESETLLNDLVIIAKKLKTKTLFQNLYSKHGKYNTSTIIRRFGTWQKALEKVALKAGNINKYSDEELFENILPIWQHKGKQPVRRDLDYSPSEITQSPYSRRFKSWSEAIKCFITYINKKDSITLSTRDVQKEMKKTSRDPSLRLRFKILKRDKFTCIHCGSSPAKEPNTEHHIDHIIPWSQGGETIEENLQTLCKDCNLGKSNT